MLGTSDNCRVVLLCQQIGLSILDGGRHSDFASSIAQVKLYVSPFRFYWSSVVAVASLATGVAGAVVAGYCLCVPSRFSVGPRGEWRRWRLGSREQ